MSDRRSHTGIIRLRSAPRRSLWLTFNMKTSDNMCDDIAKNVYMIQMRHWSTNSHQELECRLKLGLHPPHHQQKAKQHIVADGTLKDRMIIKWWWWSLRVKLLHHAICKQQWQGPGKGPVDTDAAKQAHQIVVRGCLFKTRVHYNNNGNDDKYAANLQWWWLLPRP